MAVTTIKSPMATVSLSAPSHLWIGNRESVGKHLITTLQYHFCKKGCGICSSCAAISKKQHYAIRWICPEKQYTRDILTSLFEQLAFALGTHEQFFFILEQVDFMPPSCANSLLKSLEDPPAGYYFFLCAQREHTILPTIRSRCIKHTITTPSAITQMYPLFDYFTTTTLYDPIAFTNELEQSDINDKNSVEILDALLTYWMHKAKKAVQTKQLENYQRANEVLEIISSAFQKTPMPGSSKIFWRNLYLQMQKISS